MKIAINASFLRKQNTGLGQVTINFLKQLVEFSIKNEKLSRENKYLLYLEEDIDLALPDNFQKVVFLPLWKRDDLIRKIWWEKFALPKRIKNDGCEILLSMYQCPTIVGGKKTKHIMIVHDIIPKLFPEYLNNWRKKLYQDLTETAIRKADKIVAISHRTEKDLIQHLNINPHKISVSYIDVADNYKKRVSETESKKILGKYQLTPGYIYFGGGLEMRKNVQSLLAAYKLLSETYGEKDWLPNLVISGKLMPGLAPLITDVEKLVETLELKGKVKILNFVPQEDCPALYKNAAVFVRPSLYEGFGLPELEAMNQGTPVIAAKTSSVPEVGSDSILYCDPHSKEDIAMVIKNVLTNEHLQASLSLKGRERSKHFSWEKFVQKVANIIKELNN